MRRANTYCAEAQHTWCERQVPIAWEVYSLPTNLLYLKQKELFTYYSVIKEETNHN